MAQLTLNVDGRPRADRQCGVRRHRRVAASRAVHAGASEGGAGAGLAIVMRGLDPRIHRALPFAYNHSGLPSQARQ